MKGKHKSFGNSPEAARKVKEQDGAEATAAHDAITSSKTILQRIEMEQYTSTSQVQNLQHAGAMCALHT